MPSRGSAAGQQAQRPHQVFPARRATCQQTALKKVGSKREAGQRPPQVTQPHLWSKKECTWTGTEKSARRWSSTGTASDAGDHRNVRAELMIDTFGNRMKASTSMRAGLQLLKEEQRCFDEWLLGWDYRQLWWR
jgi:hypothetical protein